MKNVKGVHMKKTALLPLIPVSLAIVTWAQQTNNLLNSGDLGIRVVIDEDDTPPTEEELLKHKMRRALPYRTEVPEFYRLRSLGQLAKVSDGVVIGKVVSARTTTPTGSSVSARFMNNVSLSVAVETVLLGDNLPRKMKIGEQWPNDDFRRMLIATQPYTWNIKKQPKTGDRVLMFLLREPGMGWQRGERAFAFRKTAVPKDGAYHITRGNDGIRHLETPEIATNYLNAVKGYLEELRGEKRDPDSYYSLLSGLVRSSVQSIREDARSDLMYFIEYCPSFDARRVLADDNIDEAIKYWVEHDVLPGREQQKADAQNEP
jgi:hypothetical protein